MSFGKFKPAAALAGVLTLAGCGQKPADVCSDPFTRDQVFSLAYTNAETTIESTDQGLDVLSRVGADTMIPRAAVVAELAGMRKEHLLSFNFVTLEGVDKQTNRISCSADVSITTASQDRTAEAKDAMKRAVQSLNINDLRAPLGLEQGVSHGNVDYWREPNSTGHYKWVFNVQNDDELVSSVIVIATERAIRHSPGAYRVPASEWESLRGLEGAASNPPDDTVPAADNTAATP